MGTLVAPGKYPGFNTASVTKLFIAVATLQLIERGLLAFDTPVIDFLGLQETSITRPVNVFHLLTHTSGIADDAEEESGEDYADIWKTRPNYAVTETADFLPQFAHKPPNFPPGQGCRYCNCSYVLWACSSKRQAVCPIGTTCVSRSSHPPKCSALISCAWT